MSQDSIEKVARVLSPWKNAICGATAGVVSRFVIAPLDVVKIRFQLQTEELRLPQITGREPTDIKYRGIAQSFARIVREEGFFALWKGNLSAAYLYLGYGAMQFYSYPEYDKFLRQQPVYAKLKLPKEVTASIAGALAGCTATLLTYPFDLLRTRFAVQGRDGPYSGLAHAVREIVQKEGVRGLYQGVWPTTLQMVPQTAIVFAVYTFCRGHLKGKKVLGMEDFISGGAAGIIGKTAVMPFDVVRKRLQVQGPTRNSYVVGEVPRYPSSFLSCVRQIVHHEGVLALYKGLLPSVLKSGPSAAVTFLMVGLCQKGFRALDE
ncbi:mitochondrial carrier domain-containing protein [Phlyctochytrium arcticum]|nr:mitochondrial carrier domain-containing protein [Phlyctochytrium arcticum]